MRTSRGRQDAPNAHLPIVVISTLSVPARWNSVFLRWQLRRALFLAIAVRILLSAVLLYANEQMSALLSYTSADRGTLVATLTGIGVALYAVALTMTVTAVDAARFGAPDLMANLGYSRARLVALSALPPALLEMVINGAVDVA